MKKFEMAVLVAADSIEVLRPCDVYRVLKEFRGNRAELAEWLKTKAVANQYIVNEVNEVMAEGDF